MDNKTDFRSELMDFMQEVEGDYRRNCKAGEDIEDLLETEDDFDLEDDDDMDEELGIEDIDLEDDDDMDEELGLEDDFYVEDDDLEVEDDLEKCLSLKRELTICKNKNAELETFTEYLYKEKLEKEEHVEALIKHLRNAEKAYEDAKDSNEELMQENLKLREIIKLYGELYENFCGKKYKIKENKQADMDQMLVDIINDKD